MLTVRTWGSHQASMLEGPRLRIIRLLRAEPALSIGRVAAVLGQDVHEVERLIDPLLEEEVIARNGDLLTVTEKGNLPHR
jgi:hypothetical protein